MTSHEKYKWPISKKIEKITILSELLKINYIYLYVRKPCLDLTESNRLEHLKVFRVHPDLRSIFKLKDLIFCFWEILWWIWSKMYSMFGFGNTPFCVDRCRVLPIPPTLGGSRCFRSGGPCQYRASNDAKWCALLQPCETWNVLAALSPFFHFINY